MELKEPTEWRVSTSFGEASVSQWGDGDETLVFLHGFTGTRKDAEGLAAFLPPGVRILALDLLGHGESPQAVHSMEDAVAFVTSVLESLAVGPVWLCGYSMGGRVALRVACRKQELLRGLCLVGASPGIEDVALRHERRAWDLEWAHKARSLTVEDFASQWAALPLLQATNPPSGPWHGRFARRRLTQLGEGLARSLEGTGAGITLPVWSELESLSLPVLCVAGELDLKYVNEMRRVSSDVPGARFACVPHVGHSVHLEAAQELAELVGDWMGFSL